MLERDPSPFITVRAVEAWDTWFRWRDKKGLHDLAVESTWQRVAAALASAETSGRGEFESALFAAQACWQLVLDERILANAGTGAAMPHDPVAVLNAAVFVDLSASAAPAFDFAAFGEAAALAVRCLDNALSSEAHARLPLDLRVGMIGLADALLLLGKRYDSADGRLVAVAIARALAEGCLRGSVALAEERGGVLAVAVAQIERARARGVPAALVESMATRGVRHRGLTAIAPHPRLAAFANNVSDAIDPIGAAFDATADSPRNAAALPFALLRLHGAAPPAALGARLPNVAAADQIRMRGAVQPWIDQPIDYPLRTSARERDGVPAAETVTPRASLVAPTH